MKDLEEEHFAKLDREKLAKLKEQWQQEAAVEALKERKELHFLKCGKCGDDMTTKPFRGVEIEVCNSCGAVLLDPGELQTLAGDDQSSFFSGILSGKWT